MRDKRTGQIGEHRYEVLTEMIANQMTAVQIANELNVNQETIRKFARKRGLRIKTHNQQLENHPMWNGGHTVDRTGYILRRVSKFGPYGYLIRAIAKRGRNGTDQTGYAPVHRIVMHEFLGRELRKGEVVDHIDGNNQNNDPSNLRVFASNAEHLKVTLKGKVPNWTPQGLANIRSGRPKKVKDDAPPPTADHSKICDLPSPQLSFL
jgi:hypothetical protein